ncbi:MAG: metal-sensitive transcriptional regulator [Candidatus Doudnabacteria bacterium]|nr:metal-sensitive transcriptional regulator [Candidatus Doudnabacteria bacterium]
MLKSNEKKLINRLHIIQGQMEGLERMIEGKKYCVDIITQSLAIQKSLQSFNQAMLENHLEEHVSHQLKHGNDSKAIKELAKIYSLSKK